MTTPWWAWVLAIVALLFLVCFPLWGVLSFSRHRAAHVIHAEGNRRVQVQVVESRFLHPEIIRVGREDRHPFFVTAILGVWCYAWCVLVGAELTSNVASLGVQTRYTMSTCFLVGASLCLVGASLGLKVRGRVIMDAVRNHLTSEVLGDDITLPYRLEIAGMSAIGISFVIYAWTSFQTTYGSLGGWLTALLAVGCGVTSLWFNNRVRTFAKQDGVLIADAQARLGIGDEDAAH